jgi:hypothetical protein
VAVSKASVRGIGLAQAAKIVDVALAAHEDEAVAVAAIRSVGLVPEPEEAGPAGH